MGGWRKKRREESHQPGSAVRDPSAPDEAEVIDYVRALLLRHRIEKPLFQSMLQRLGVAGIVELTSAIGYYAMISCTLNAFALTSSPNPKDYPI